MAVYTPPTENIPIFDRSAFPSSDGTALTIASGRKYFLTYPVAQGSEIFPSNVTLQSTLTDSTGAVGTAGQFLSSTVTGTQWSNFAVSGNLDLPPPYGLLTDTITQSASHVSGNNINLYGTTTTDDILIGSTLPAGKTLRLCNTTSGASGGSVHCSNIGFDGSNINNATNSTTGTIKFANSQTTGTLYVGGGSATVVRTTGPIIIGSDSTASGGINIGTGTDLTAPSVNTVNIGQTTYTTNVKGPLTSTGLITANGDITSPNITATTKFKGIMYDAPTAASTLSIGETLTNGATSAIVPLMIGLNITGTPTIGIQLGNSATKIKLEGATTALSLATASGSISSAGAITGTSVIAPSLNASADTTDMGISTTQTSGVLNLGTGNRVLTGNGGGINIGTGSGATANPITIRGTASVITLAGPTTLGKALTLPATYTTPTVAQLGYNNSIANSSAAVSVGTTATTILATGSVLPLGTFMLTIYVVASFSVANSTMSLRFVEGTGVNITGRPPNDTLVLAGSATAGNKSSLSCTFVATSTNTGNNGDLTFSGLVASGTGTVAINGGKISWTKIA